MGRTLGALIVLLFAMKSFAGPPDASIEQESIRFQGARFGNFGGWPNFLYQPRFTNCVSCWPGSAR